MRFGRLTVVGSFDVKAKDKVLCRCDCGKEKSITKGNLVQGYTKSCGCLQKERVSSSNRSHGMTSSATHRVWIGMMGRCYVKTNSRYSRYGGKGITVCKEWHDFTNFLRDMGERPDGMSIDRIDNSKGYQPGNCRWATLVGQANNKTNNRMVEVNGESKTLAMWCAEKNMPYFSVVRRIKRGWSVERALNEPLDKRKCANAYKGV